MNAWKIVTCVRQALDWNLSTKDFRIDAQTGAPAVAFARYRIDQFDEIAMEVALQAKNSAVVGLHALSAGAKASEDVLKHALAMGAESATLIDTTGEDTPDAPALLACAIRRAGGADLVLCGRTGSGRGSATTAPLIAELLQLPLVTNLVRVARDDRGWICEREHEGAYGRILVHGPFVATVTNAAFNVPRVPALKDKIRAHRQQVEFVPAPVLARDCQHRPSGVARVRLVRRYVPQLSRQCNRLSGPLSQQARALAQYIASAIALQR